MKSQTDRDRHKSSRDLSAGSTPRSGSDATSYPPKLMVQEKIHTRMIEKHVYSQELDRCLCFISTYMEQGTKQALVKT